MRLNYQLTHVTAESHATSKDLLGKTTNPPFLTGATVCVTFALGEVQLLPTVKQTTYADLERHRAARHTHEVSSV